MQGCMIYVPTIMRYGVDMTEKLSDQWQTPQWLYDELNEEFNFDIDLCATSENSKCYAYGTDYLHDEFMTRKNDLCSFSGYKIGVDWAKDSTCFMNPPYSNPKPFIEKAWEDSKHCKIVCLVKCDPSTKWWSTFWDYKRKCNICHGTGKEVLVPCIKCNGSGHINGPKPGCEVRFFSKRIKFDPPKGFEGKASSPSFASALIIMDRRGL